MRTPKLATLTLFCAALGALAVSVVPGAVLAQNVPSYGTPAARQEMVRGTVTGFNGQYIVYLRDQRGYNDNVTLHQGTIIDPTGIRLVEGMRVSIWGYADGPTFDAYQVEVAGGGPYYAGYYGYGSPYDGYYGYGYPAVALGIGVGWGWGWGGPWGWGFYHPWGWGWGRPWGWNGYRGWGGYRGPYGYRGWGYRGPAGFRGGYYGRGTLRGGPAPRAGGARPGGGFRGGGGTVHGGGRPH